MGYWTSSNMNDLLPEFIELFKFLYPNHVMLLNMDQISNHAAMSPKARTLGNMRVRAGGERKVNGKVAPMPIFKPYKLSEGDIGPDVQAKWASKVQNGRNFHFKFKRSEVPSCEQVKEELKKELKGKAIGKRELAYRLGWWKPGMTEKGKAKATRACLTAPTKFQCGDLVARLEEDQYELYRVEEVPLAHKSTKSSQDIIKCMWFKPLEEGGSADGEGERVLSLTPRVWDDKSFKANTMMWVDPTMVRVVSGHLNNKKKCQLEFNTRAY